MLPGVEAARRRRFHYSTTNNPERHLTATRRSSFCLYASNNEFRFSTATSSVSNQQGRAWDESGLSTEAREAKKRLDERLHHHHISNTNRISRNQNLFRFLKGKPNTYGAEVPILKKNGSKRLNWLKSNWNSSEQKECTICLEELKDGHVDDTLKELPCAHKFHTKCLMPWLSDNSHCPCCRMRFPSSMLA